ncbi:TIGR04013 family B12-binding domain/radical SAM domain-containing protein [bacterium]|nr:TIGR04013 family B12-binding domain/radical SAM domain-containing protein [bacterium]
MISNKTRSLFTLVAYNHKKNKNSLRILLGAFERSELYQKSRIVLYDTKTDLVNGLGGLIHGQAPVFLLISLHTIQIRETARLLAQLRARHGRTFMAIGGGPQASGDPHRTLELGFDYLVRGEAEQTLSLLIESLLNGRAPEHIQGIVYRVGSEIRDTGFSVPVCLDDYPPFAADLRLYGYIEISRGCPHGCSYCQTPRVFGTRQRHRTLDLVLDHVLFLHKRGLGTYRFLTPNALTYGSTDGRTPNIETVEMLLAKTREIIGPVKKLYYGSFPSEIRPELISPGVIRMLKKYIDNDNLIIGAQSGSQRILDLAHRHHTVEQVVQAVRWIREAGLKANVDFIVGFPDETETDWNETRTCMENLLKAGARIHAHFLIPLPQTIYVQNPPRLLPDRVRQYLNLKASHGQLFGQWQTQERLSLGLIEYFQTGKIAS